MSIREQSEILNMAYSALWDVTLPNSSASSPPPAFSWTMTALPQQLFEIAIPRWLPFLGVSAQAVASSSLNTLPP